MCEQRDAQALPAARDLGGRMFSWQLRLGSRIHSGEHRGHRFLTKETDPHLSTTSFQVVVESDKVSPQPPFLQAKQPQFPQPLFIRLLL
ncbi:hypothetical protein QYF61_013375 [Mycteria americana]|uniref:Uncharacterized protein n=1 Tax=Mycteria americana TaxID=33587 RepID=A0AAN7ML31_MYCAM|nr:hypothetical protein QYF61_013375 [Mycteria americana]